MGEKNSLYWAYNLPLQVWPKHQNPDDENSPVVGARVLNYMPRKERCMDCDLNELLGEQTREEFFESAAQHLENLARLMREAGKDPEKHVYYHDTGMTPPNNQVQAAPCKQGVAPTTPGSAD